LPALVVAILAAGGSVALAEFMTPCDRTAMRAFRACVIDTNEEYHLAAANCIQIGEVAARAECWAAAGETRTEDREECADVLEARRDLCDVLDEYRYDPDPLLDPQNSFIHPDEVPDIYPANSLLSIEEGLVRVIGSEDEIVVILNTDETREIHGVECRIVAEAAFEIEEDEEDGEIEYLPIEVTFDYYAQTETGDVIYCGENTVEYEDEFPVSTDGTFIAGEEHAKAGRIMRAAPMEGDADRQEFFLDDAEDYVVYEDLAATPAEDLGGEVEGFECDGACTQTLEGTPLEPDTIELKYYVPDVGFVLAVPLELNDDDEFEWTGEREELLCAGDSLDILASEDCDIDDPAELLKVVCFISGDWFCDDD
jgi:hypothetical protein